MQNNVMTGRKGTRLLAIVLATVILLSGNGLRVLARTVSENEMLAENDNSNGETESIVEEILDNSKASSSVPANPIYDADTDTTTWSYVYFGSYPQSEVTDKTLISAIDEAITQIQTADSAYVGKTADIGTDVWVNGTKYRRISVDDTNYYKYFGKGTNNGYRYFKWDRIKWRVLQNNGSTLFVVSDMSLDCKNYHNDDESITWEKSTIREWLNNSFYQTAFSNNEQNAIVKQTVENEDSYYGIEGGENTEDKVYLLSRSDVINAKYGFCNDYSLYSESRFMQPSNYSSVRGANTGNNTNCWWWLRTPGKYMNYATYVADYGGVERYGSRVDIPNYAISPVLHINLSSGVWFMTDDNTSGDGGEERIMTALKAVKAKTTYTLGESLSTDDLKVTVEYHTGSKRSMGANEYTTNAKKIDMNTVGKKSLTVSYKENNVTKTTDITITVNKATPYINIAPTAEAITEGASLNTSKLTGGSVWRNVSDNSPVPGNFTWKNNQTFLQATKRKKMQSAYRKIPLRKHQHKSCYGQQKRCGKGKSKRYSLHLCICAEWCL